MISFDAMQSFSLAIDAPHRPNRPIKTLANSLQDVLRGLNKVMRLRKDFRDGILQRQPVLGSLSLSDISRKATSVNKLAIFAVDAGINTDVLYRTVLATQSGVVTLKHFTGLLTPKNVFDNILIG